MPISKENRARYPANWSAIRAAILERARNRCEWCGVPNHAVGYRDELGAFVPACGNMPVDFAGCGLAWPGGAALSYAEAAKIVDGWHCRTNGRDDEGRRWIVIVLTIAHVGDDDRPENDNPADLAALCQRCHNKHDAPARARRRIEKQSAQKTYNQGELF
jgi:5-methylcytosine-specific restriction endonuclease McrA